MQLLKIKLFQETACYLKPFAFKVGETYPLAPFSTVKGMLHAILDAKEYIPLQLSIQGEFESMFVDYQKKYMYKKSDVPAQLITDGLKEQVETDSNLVTTMPMYQHLLFNVTHVMHVQAEPTILEELYNKFQNLSTTVSLGRWEDLVRVDQVELIEVQEEGNDVTKYTQYIPATLREEYEMGENSPFYHLPRKYTIVRGCRQWDYIEAMLISKETDISLHDCFDEEGLPIFLMEG